MFSYLKAFCGTTFTLYVISNKAALIFIRIFPIPGNPCNPRHSTYALATTLGSMRLDWWRQ